MVRAVTVREPEFSAWDRAALLRDVVDSNARRGSHGLLVSDATDPTNQFAFEVPNPTMDFAQKALDDAQESYKKSNPNAPMGALLWRVQRRDASGASGM